jgi:hypothetical protein
MEPVDLQLHTWTFRERYLEELPQRVAEVTRLLEQIKNETVSVKPWSEMERLTYELAASGATYGCPEVSEIASDIFCVCHWMAANVGANDIVDLRELDQQVAALTLAARHFVASEPDHLHIQENGQLAAISTNRMAFCPLDTASMSRRRSPNGKGSWVSFTSRWRSRD